MLRPAAAALACALAGCAPLVVSPAAPSPFEAPVISIAGDEITYRGELVSDSAGRVLAVAGSRPVRTLRIASGGGEVGSAIDLARWVRRNGVDVIVDGPCFSSCANYIFPAGREKHIVGRGMVAWHGNLQHLLYLDAHGGKELAGKRALFDPVLAKERAFFAEIGVNGYLAWFGKIAPYNTWNSYFLSQEDMEYFGLTGLHVRADYLATDVSNLDSDGEPHLRLLTIDRAVTNASDPNWMIGGAVKNIK